MFIKTNFTNGTTCDKLKVCSVFEKSHIDSHILVINFRVEMQLFSINFFRIVVVKLIRLARWKWNKLIINCIKKWRRMVNVKCVELTTINNNHSFCDKFRASGWYNRIYVINDQQSAIIIFRVLIFIFVFVAIN